MALNKTTLKNELKGDFETIFADVSGNKTAADKAEELAVAIANRIDTFVKTAEVATTVVGVCPSGGGPLASGAGTGSLS